MSSMEINGVHHLALVCKDMERTVDFYTNVLGMRLTKGFDLEGYGQHFFFVSPRSPERARAGLPLVWVDDWFTELRDRLGQ